MSLDISIVNECMCCHSTETHFDSNITHNLTPMWSKAGVYDALYNSEGKAPCEVMDEVGKGLNEMRTNQKEFEKLNPDNGWGDYDSAVNFLEKFYDACCENAYHSKIHIWK